MQWDEDFCVFESNLKPFEANLPTSLCYVVVSKDQKKCELDIQIWSAFSILYDFKLLRLSVWKISIAQCIWSYFCSAYHAQILNLDKFLTLS